MSEAAPPSASSSPLGSEGLVPTVLIADDDALSRKTIAALLSPLGCHVRFARHGQEALDAVEQEPPDLVLLDVMMPGLDGFEVCRRLRERWRERYLPIILITALDGRQDVLRGLEAGADDFLQKPVHGAELRARVSNLIKVRAYHQLLAAQRDSALAMADSLRQQVLHADRLATLGTFAAGVSHELNNIAQVLSSVLAASPVSPSGAWEPVDREMLAHAVGHVAELSRALLNVSRPAEDAQEEVDLVRTLEEVRNMLRLTGRTRHAPPSLVLPDQVCLIRANPVHAQQVFLNLMANAADAVEGTPEPAIEAGVRLLPEGWLEAWVQDNGPGMSERVRARIFEPFFSTKPAGFGTGLGLPVVKQIVESWGGRIHVHTEPGKGTRMVLELPAAPAPEPGR